VNAVPRAHNSNGAAVTEPAYSARTVAAPIEMTFETDNPAHQEIAREEQARIFGNVAGARVLAIPLLAALALALAWFEPIGWRAAVLVTLSVLIPSFFLVELKRYRRLGLERSAIPRNLVLTALAQLAVSAATGGILSPFVYGVIPIAAMSGTFMEKSSRLLLAAFQVSAVFGFVVLALHTAIPGFASSAASAEVVSLPGTHYYFHAVTLSFVTLAIGQLSHLLSGTFASTFRRASNAQHALLLSHAERVKELTTLSAEIAHELKNPLASIKGLSALLAQNVADERGTERLRVLRREIDRMQGALDEFLNFSRPLVPLSLKQCNISDLARDVVLLHEGLARQRGVRLITETMPIAVSCDPRKVQQILINLVQNALEAASSNTEITLRTSERDGFVLLEVIDQGAGLDPALGDVFAPGTTSKSGGAGIGLTIARALARQHGGDLTLAANEGRGARAELRLPKVATVAAEDEK
jgi:two-component system, NtrC family, sensor histidine kinase HydH